MKIQPHLLACAGMFLLLTACQGAPAPCGEDDYSAGFERIGVLRSTDGGTTWDFLGNACFHAPALIPVDPSPLASADGIVLYFLDLKSLGQPPGAGRIIHRAVSRDGLTFDPPEPAFSFGENITDPYVLALAGGGYRMYLMLTDAPGGILSASSQDGLAFTFEPGARTHAGATPGALLLPDGRIRLFVAGDPDGITSLISTDGGMHFDLEDGVRIPTEGLRLTDPHPIALRAGGYLMVYALQPQGTYADEQARLAAIEIHLASSEDAVHWIQAPGIIALGSVPALVETADGSLYLYYVDASHRRSP